MPDKIEFRATILRKQEDLPRYIVIPDGLLSDRLTSFSALISLNDGPCFPRNIHPWRKGRSVFFFNLTADQCRRSNVETGDEVKISLTTA